MYTFVIRGILLLLRFGRILCEHRSISFPQRKASALEGENKEFPILFLLLFT